MCLMELDIQQIQNGFWASHFWKHKEEVANCVASQGEKKLNVEFMDINAVFIFINSV